MHLGQLHINHTNHINHINLNNSMYILLKKTKRIRSYSNQLMDKHLHTVGHDIVMSSPLRLLLERLLYLFMKKHPHPLPHLLIAKLLLMSITNIKVTKHIALTLILQLMYYLHKSRLYQHLLHQEFTTYRHSTIMMLRLKAICHLKKMIESN